MAYRPEILEEESIQHRKVMRTRSRRFRCNGTLLALLACFAYGCDATGPTDFEPEVVVEGYLAAGRRLPDLRLSRTVPIDAAYNRERTGIDGAFVEVRLLDAAGGTEEKYEYRGSDASAGLYFPTTGWNDTPNVRPLRTYELYAEVPGEPGPITSRTLVPDTFFVADISADSVEYLSRQQLSFQLSPTVYPGRQNVYLITTVAQDGFIDHLTPFAEALLEDSDLTMSDLRERTAPLLNEANFDRMENGFIHVRFPWIGIYFYGRNEILINAIDDNLHDFIRSQTIQQGGSTLPPGEIPNVLEHVSGGRGVFGSYARASVNVFVSRPANE